MNDFTPRLKRLKKADDELKAESARTEEREKQLKKSIKDIKAEMKQLTGSSSVDKLESKIAELTAEVDQELTKMEGIVSHYEDAEGE